MTISSFLIIFLYTAIAFAASDYIWPLSKNYGISATFGESRSDHYHGGIDISTNGETGLPVLAVADGSIYRMKIQKRGYGKALYIQHRNGTQSVYAHLDSYSQELGLQKLYTQKSARMGTPYVGDIFLEPPISIRQGQVVAFSGESGAGLPHLHLEIRKNENVIVNPLTIGFTDTMDPVPPTFQAVYFYPLSSDATIDGDLDTKEFRLKRKESVFVADSTPIVRGDFAISVSVYDSALRPYHRTPYKLIYTIDDREVYSIELDQFSYTQPEGFGLFYDQGKPGPSFYEYPILMTKMAEFPLPFVKRSPSFSTRSLAPGPHKVKIRAIDTNNNISIAEIPIVVNDPPAATIDSVQTASGELVVGVTLQDSNWSGAGPLSGEVEYSLDDGRSFRAVTLTTLDVPELKNSLKFRYRIPLSQVTNAKNVLVRARAYDGVEYSSYAFEKFRQGGIASVERNNPLPSGNSRFETYRRAIRVIFDADEPLAGNFQLTAGDPPSIFPLELRKLNSLVGHIPAPKQNGDFVIALRGGQSLTVPVRFIKKGVAAKVTTDNTQLYLQESSLYEDAWIWPKTLPRYESKSLPVIGSILQLGPRGLALKKAATLTFSFSSNVSNPEKLSIYRWDRAGQRWISLGSELNRGSRTVAAKINFLDMFALILDNVSPKISPIFPKRKSTTSNQQPVLAVHIRDAGTDVDDERITFYVDGVPYPAEYDPDRNTATAKVGRVLNKGSHSFYAVAYDYAGNQSKSSAVTFRVK